MHNQSSMSAKQSSHQVARVKRSSSPDRTNNNNDYNNHLPSNNQFRGANNRTPSWSSTTATNSNSFLQCSLNWPMMRKYIQDVIMNFKDEFQSAIYGKFKSELDKMSEEMDALRERMIELERATTSIIISEAPQPIEVVNIYDDLSQEQQKEEFIQQPITPPDLDDEQDHEDGQDDFSEPESDIDNWQDPDYNPAASQNTFSLSSTQTSQATYYQSNVKPQNDHSLDLINSERNQTINDIILSRNATQETPFGYVYSILACDVKFMTKVMDIVGRSRTATYYVLWETGLKKWIRLADQPAREQFRHLRLSYWREHYEKKKRETAEGKPRAPRNSVQKKKSKSDKKKPKIIFQKMRTNGFASKDRNLNLKKAGLVASTELHGLINGNGNSSRDSTQTDPQASEETDEMDDLNDADFNAHSSDEQDGSSEYSSSDEDHASQNASDLPTNNHNKTAFFRQNLSLEETNN